MRTPETPEVERDTMADTENLVQWLRRVAETPDLRLHNGAHVECQPGMLRGAADEIERLQKDCSEAYQAVGFLADCLGYWQMSPDDPRQEQITKLLDNLHAAADGESRSHDDLLPFGWQR